ncbi:MAG TPA: methionine synthase, partial [Kiritimatiellae bacterium]|nr:methionine synthase [Kiritimatiellia bacterium]
MDLRARLHEGLFLMDGAMGTQIQASRVAPEAWLDRPGCNEILNLSRPDLIADIHRRYLETGCDAVETNSFGGSPLTLAEYGLEDKATEINRSAARIAREVADELATAERPRFVFGSVGPGARLASLGQVRFEQLRGAYRVQIEALLEGGCDGIIVETCQDPLQIKAAVIAFREVTGGDRGVLLYVSFTIETSGTMLVGTDASTLLAVVEPLRVDILGINCGTGPGPMRVHLDTLAAEWPGFLAVMPNAGLPVLRSGVVTYPLPPAQFAAETAALVRKCGLNVVGGCCGTTPEP